MKKIKNKPLSVENIKKFQKIMDFHYEDSKKVIETAIKEQLIYGKSFIEHGVDENGVPYFRNYPYKKKSLWEKFKGWFK